MWPKWLPKRFMSLIGGFKFLKCAERPLELYLRAPVTYLKKEICDKPCSFTSLNLNGGKNGCISSSKEQCHTTFMSNLDCVQFKFAEECFRQQFCFAFCVSVCVQKLLMIFFSYRKIFNTW